VTISGFSLEITVEARAIAGELRNGFRQELRKNKEIAFSWRKDGNALERLQKPDAAFAE
jgi:hypothetical protein